MCNEGLGGPQHRFGTVNKSLESDGLWISLGVWEGQRGGAVDRQVDQAQLKELMGNRTEGP